MGFCPNLQFDEAQWIIRIRRILDEEIEVHDSQPISIFDVPKPILRTKPEAYTPQLVALGPYHHCREELRDMEMYKLSAARRAQRHLPGMNFQQLVAVFATLKYEIRAHYHRHLGLSNDALAWMMAIDVSFLLEFLETFSQNNSQRTILQRIPSRMSHLVDPSRRTSSHSMEVSSLMGTGSPCTDMTQHVHLLDFLYSNMAPCYVEGLDDATEEADDDGSHHVKRTLLSVTDLLIKRGIKFLSLLIDFNVRILLKLVACIPCLSVIAQSIQHLNSQQTQRQPKEEASDFQNNNSISPLLEEIAVPCVAELAYSGVKFIPANGGISTIEFCAKAATLHLPVIRVDVNTEVLLRNMVAYEASTGCRSLVLARYIELMNGIIDTDEDARLLRESGVIRNHLKSDKEVAELWNGMTRSVRLTRVAALDRVIDDLNRHHSSCWKVRINNFFKAQVLGSRELVACITMLLLILFMSLQAFCAARGCIPAWYGMPRTKGAA
ncbi:hypothetical protein E2562_038112 [Oryza meyeriana var. granulata]|uniref:Uncharacterized protein n=1 Tax=Oryza meyeriana var. granulata TaxID=110450 RepID=A0A6G1EBS6_9ORYZ|nr:hypothetical protein E2562_038112 [Oryza meyeriana var. granulata]